MVKTAIAANSLPAKAINIEALFDLVLTFLSILETVARIFGIDFRFGAE